MSENLPRVDASGTTAVAFSMLVLGAVPSGTVWAKACEKFGGFVLNPMTGTTIVVVAGTINETTEN